jgi:site-specific DNA-methyltransferase (adenine-specific)
MLTTTQFNPDVLSCLANLSNDEVFTPPKLANEMLDLLPKELWSNKDAKFLDPVCKTGVFLREIAKRLLTGLENEIPHLQTRIDHVFKNQLYGIGITELTALMSRRTLYCSKKANGKYSIYKFKNADGNIMYRRVEHTWVNERCSFCGASKAEHDRQEHLETYAYQFVHTTNPRGIFKMKFDVIIGNPPYHMSDGGFGRSSTPIYQDFVEQAKKLEPRYLTMIIPSRWFAGGKGLGGFRASMLGDSRIRKVVDHENASDVFPGVDIAGGVCYFLWDRESAGDCEITNVCNEQRVVSTRALNEFPTFIRHSQAIPIVRKVLSKKEPSLSEQVSSAKPFGLRTFARPQKTGDLLLRWHGGEGPYKRKDITVGEEWIDKWKVITSKVSYDHAGLPDANGFRRVFSIIDILPPGTICTETYLVVGAFDTEGPAKNLADYLRTRFVRFLVSQLSFSQDIFKEKFAFVPALSMRRKWTDETLYNRYEISDDEIAFIESKIRPMQADLFT